MSDYVPIRALRSKRRPSAVGDGRLLSGLTAAAITGEDNFAVSGPMQHQPGESIKALGARIAEAGGLTRGAAELIASNIIEPNDALLTDRYARKLITRAKTIDQWERSRFERDPSPLRGSLALCRHRTDLEKMRPSIAGAMRETG